jgi:hypothetical protein
VKPRHDYQEAMNAGELLEEIAGLINLLSALLRQLSRREEGYRGQHALNRAHAILWPKPTTSIIDTAIRDDDADFVEECVLKAFDTTDPVYIVGVSFYTTRKKSPILPASWNGQLHGLRSRWQRIGLTGACRYFRRKLSYLQGKA